MGEKLIFIGIANGQIYLERTDPFEIQMIGNKLIKLSVDLCSEGWELYFEPMKFYENETEYKYSGMDKKQLESELKKAVENEDYEIANKLKQILNTLKII